LNGLSLAILPIKLKRNDKNTDFTDFKYMQNNHFRAVAKPFNLCSHTKIRVDKLLSLKSFICKKSMKF